MLNIRLNARVESVEGACGTCAQIVLNPRTERVTHLVVREDRSPHTQRLVPMGQVLNSGPHLIQLRCTREELAGMQDFVEREHVRVSVPPAYWPVEYAMSSIYLPPTTDIAIEHLRVPPGAVALRRGVRVQAADGPVGEADEFILGTSDGDITHLAMRDGRMWGKRQLLIPVWLIDRIEGDTVYLKLNKRYLGALSMTRGRVERRTKEG